MGATASSVASRSESQSADLFQELQREVQSSLSLFCPFTVFGCSIVALQRGLGLNILFSPSTTTFLCSRNPGFERPTLTLTFSRS